MIKARHIGGYKCTNECIQQVKGAIPYFVNKVRIGLIQCKIPTMMQYKSPIKNQMTNACIRFIRYD